MTQLSLKGLEIFRLAARHGSITAVARDSGLSVSTVSHHLRRLEVALGLTLLDHGRRPMGLTPEGAVFLPHVEAALDRLARGQAELYADKISQIRSLRLALIEDFDSEIAPDLARQLAASLPECSFTHLTRPSHEILDLLARGQVDIGICTQPLFAVDGPQESPLLRDPFVLAVPADADHRAEAYLEGATSLPFLRYASGQIIGAHIEAQLRRLRRNLAHRFSFESNQSLFALIADGGGWAITTPMNFARAQRFQSRVRLLPFPGQGFARTISIHTTPACNSGVAGVIGATLRRLISTCAIAPTVAAMPWLGDRFRLLENGSLSPEY
jgi:DNA-binding transcriptional LysR family regulator